MQFLLGRHTLNNSTGDFQDAWEMSRDNFINSQCDESGSCYNPCANNEGEESGDNENTSRVADMCNGFTFNALDSKPLKRIDFIFVRGNLNLKDFSIIGKQPLFDGKEKIMASDHFGLLAKFKPPVESSELQN